MKRPRAEMKISKTMWTDKFCLDFYRKTSNLKCWYEKTDKKDFKIKLTVEKLEGLKNE